MLFTRPPRGIPNTVDDAIGRAESSEIARFGRIDEWH